MIITKENETLLTHLDVVSFSEAVENHLRENKFDSYLKALVSLSDELDLDEKEVAKLISPTLRDKIRVEAEEDGHLFKESKPMVLFG